jgi:type I restriction enzyme S subunit
VTPSEPVVGPWELPEGWRWKRLHQVADVIAGQSPRSEDCNRDGVGLPFFQGKAEFGLDYPAVRNWCEAPTKRAKPGDILISVRAPVGPTNVANLTCGIGRGLAAIRTHAIDPRLLRFWLERSEQWLIDRATGTTFQAITGDVLRSHLVPVPSPKAQRELTAKISALIVELNNADDALARVRADLRLWRKTLLKAATTGELTADWRVANPPIETGEELLARTLIERRVRWHANSRNAGKKYREPAGSGPHNLGSLPPGWVRTTVEQLAFVENGQTPKGIDGVVSDDGDIPWFKVSSMNATGNHEFLTHSQWRISRENAKTIGLHIHEAGTIVFPKRGGSIFTEKKRRLGCDAAFDLNVMGVTPLASTNRYVWMFFRNLSLTSISDGSNVPQINYDDVAQLVLNLPPQSERDRVCDLVEDLLMQTYDTEQEVDFLVSETAILRQSILAAAFRGDLIQ